MTWLKGILTRKTAYNEILYHKPFNIDKNLKYDAYQRGLASMVLIKRFLVVVLKMRISQTKNYLKYYRNNFLKDLKSEEYTHLL